MMAVVVAVMTNPAAVKIAVADKYPRGPVITRAHPLPVPDHLLLLHILPDRFAWRTFSHPTDHRRAAPNPVL